VEEICCQSFARSLALATDRFESDGKLPEIEDSAFSECRSLTGLRSQTGADVRYKARTCALF
jgi:hypothetical protein